MSLTRDGVGLVDAVANRELNKRHFDARLGTVAPSSLAARLRDVDAFLADATSTDTSWVGLYHGGLRERLRGARVLELGAGDGLNALAMAALGAEVVAMDLSTELPRLLGGAAAELGLSPRVRAISGDFEEMDLPGRSFDFVVGKAFLHHLTHELEDRYLARVAALLRPAGEARFAEPAVNSRVLDSIRWLVPMPGRPSRLSPRAFARYRAADAHPRRDNSSAHFRRAGLRHFSHVEIVAFGGLERLHRLLPDGETSRRLRRFAYRAERLLPAGIRTRIARSQVIILREPRGGSSR